MDGRLACQTDETTDARQNHGATVDDCEDCRVVARLRGAPVALADDERAGPVTSLARAALGLGQRADARSVAPRDATAIRAARDD